MDSKDKSLFKVKSKNPHLSCVVYRGRCSCGEEYVGETERMWKNIAVNKTTQQKKMDQQGNCLITLVTCCVRYSDACSKIQTSL